MTNRCCGLLLTLLLLASCQSGPVSAPANGSHDLLRRVRFIYEVCIPAPAGTRELRVWVPLPLSDPGVQEVDDLRVFAPGAIVRQTRESRHGNSMAFVTVRAPTGPLAVRWEATITRWEDSGQGMLPLSERYLEANRLVPVDGAALDLARKLGVDTAITPVSTRAKTIYDDVLAAMKYDKKHEGWGRGSFEHATTVCKGNCTDFHARFIGTGRAAGIASRFTMGVPMKPGPGTYNSYHCWAHWHDGAHWRPVDISEADKVVAEDPETAERFFGVLGRDRIGLSVGRDIVLSPPQESGVLNYFVFPHAEADGKSMKLDKSMWTFSWRDV